MNRQNKDLKIFILSVVINLLILFLIPGIKIDEIVDKKLKVGLVALETNSKKTTTKPEPKKKSTPVKEEKKEEKKVVKKEESKTSEKKVEVKETKKLSLDDLAKSISKRETEFLAIDKPSSREINSDLKKELLDKKNLQEIEKKSLVDPTKDMIISKETEVLDKSIDSQLDNNTKELDFQGAGDEELGFKTMVEKNGADGLPSGYRLGVEDGDVVAKWDQGNREPRYPEAAQLRGMQGKVLLKIQIDETGKVTSVFIEKGSGVPEINMAIEEIARTWKIYLTKNGLNIKGNVSLEYSFKLLGAS
ncbi:MULTISPECIES: energy transducer TonB [Cetobacterium]|uniref:Energy transducer TonB n=1 Tax=Candidatus Cetobacterium colombiensis TaxID=3073100 RepID=A0ABU4W7L5_9FUSO|nr:energy transducer TonB [Candidatus Cetobacterium colombiensis]MDX8335518.1 energy transducer TonB [Candidatus Cetobacterium colombiensis]